MRITIENTTKIVCLNGVHCRVWEGATDSGVKLHCYIPRVREEGREKTAT